MVNANPPWVYFGGAPRCHHNHRHPGCASLPAVQAVRKASPGAPSAENNLGQIGLGAWNHVSSQKHYPTSGWGYTWCGDPDRGFGRLQPGGWIYNTLPFIEETTTHDLGKGLAGQRQAQRGRPAAVDAGGRLQLPVAPPAQDESRHRRRPRTHRTTSATRKPTTAGNGGEIVQTWGGPSAGATTASPPSWVTNNTGITFVLIRPRHADRKFPTARRRTDRVLGQKNLEPQYYENGGGAADNGSMYQGHDWDNPPLGAIADLPPTPDRRGVLMASASSAARTGKAATLYSATVRGSSSTTTSRAKPTAGFRTGTTNSPRPLETDRTRPRLVFNLSTQTTRSALLSCAMRHHHGRLRRSIDRRAA